MGVDLVQLKEWAEALCRVPSSDPGDVRGALRIDGPAPGRGADPDADPGTVPGADPGPASCGPDVTCEIGLLGSAFRSLAVTFAVPEIPRAAFDDAMGHGLLLRPVGHRPRRRVAYRVVIPDAPYSVDVVVGFAGPPQPDAPATDVVLRRRRGVTRLRGELVDEEGWVVTRTGPRRALR